MTELLNKLKINNLNKSLFFKEKLVFFLEEWYSPQKTVKVQTSGSTGTPKILDIEKEKMLHSAKMTCDFLGLNENHSALLCLPLEYISGKMMVVRALQTNMTLHISEPSITPLENLDFSIDFCAMTPLQVEHSLDKLPLIKNLIIGGATVSESLKKKIYQNLEHKNINMRIFETYGMSETLSHIALKEIFPNKKPYFETLNNIEISQDERGCLSIFAPKLNNETLKTNDLVEIKSKKEFRFLGRVDNIINSGGAKIFPEELESFIKTHIENEAVLVGTPDEILGEKLILVLEGIDNESIINKILNLKFEKSFHKPKKIFFVEKIPRTPNGKVDRLTLKKTIFRIKFLTFATE